MNKDDFCITSDYTLLEAANAIKATKHRGVLVINESDKVCGFISQGDIIDAIKDQISLYAHVDAILKPSFLYVRERNLEKAFPLFRDKRISVLPVVDEDFHLIDIITLQDILDHAVVREDT